MKSGVLLSRFFVSSPSNIRSFHNTEKGIRYCVGPIAILGRPLLALVSQLRPPALRSANSRRIGFHMRHHIKWRCHAIVAKDVATGWFPASSRRLSRRDVMPALTIINLLSSIRKIYSILV
jgi:hypothetical protein